MRILFKLALVFAVISLPLGAWAENVIMDEVIVTATKSETNLMVTPIAITVLSGEELIQQNIKDVRDLPGVVPNLFIGEDNAQSAVEITLRGVGNDNNTELGDPNVGFHVDGVYVPRPQSAVALMYDLERLEVLRGPQGTIFGRNSTVGVINLVTSKPDFNELAGDLKVDFGAYNKEQLRATVNIPFADNWAVRANFMTDRRDGYITQVQDFAQSDQRRNVEVGDSEEYTNTDQRAFRISSLWEPFESLSWHLTYENFQDKSAGGIYLAVCDQNPTACPGNDEYYARVNVPGKKDLTLESWRSVLTWLMNDSLELVYRGAYSEQDLETIYEEDAGLGFEVILGHNPTHNDSQSHEITLQSTSNNRFQWIVGGFYFEEETDIKFDVDLPSILLGLTFWQPERTLQSRAVFAQGTFDVSDKLSVTAGWRWTEDEKEDKNGGNFEAANWDVLGGADPAAALFVPCTWGNYLDGQLASNLSNGLGAFSKSPTSVVNDDFGGSCDVYGNFRRTSDNSFKAGWSKNTWRLGADYIIDNNMFAYVSLATGFKAGGFTDKVEFPVDSGEFTAFPYDPEEVTTTEIGFKGIFFDSTLRLSAAVFYSDYEDMQRTTVVTLGERIVDIGGVPTVQIVNQLLTQNASEATISGLEVEFDWFLGDFARLSGFATLLDTEVGDWLTQDTRLCSNRFGGDCPVTNLKGNQLKNSPEHTISLTYEHFFRLGSYRLIPAITVRDVGEYYVRDFNYDSGPIDAIDPFSGAAVIADGSVKENGYTAVDIRVRVEPESGRWYLEAYGSNVTDEIWKTRYFDVGGVVVDNFNAPKTYGVRFGLGF